MSDIGRPRRVFVFGVLAVIALQIGEIVWLWADGYDAVSSDELFRSYQAYLWSKSPSLFPDFQWPPLFYWVYGTALAIVPDPLWTPRVVTLALGALNTLLAARLLVRGSRDRGSVLVILAAWTLSPLFLRLASVALAETLTTTCLLVALDRFFVAAESGAHRPLVVCALAFAAAALTRFETWLLVALFGAWLVLRPADGRERHRRAVIAAIPAAAIVALMIHGALSAGDPFIGFTAFVRHGETQNLGRVAVAVAVLESLVAGAPLVLLLAVAGFVRRRAAATPFRDVAIGIAVVALGFPAAFLAVGQLPTQYAARIAALPLTLLLPVAALGLSTLASWRRFVTVVAVATIVVAFFQARTVEPPFPHAIKAGKALRALSNSGVIRADDSVFAEATDWDGLGIGVFSNLKERVRFDVEPRSSKPSLFLHPRLEKLGADLFAAGVRWVLVREPAFAERARRAFAVVETVGVSPYELMRVTMPRLPAPP